MTIREIIYKAHRQFANNTDYPDINSEEMAVYIDHANDAITEWAMLALEGFMWGQLITHQKIDFIDGKAAIPQDFMCLKRKINIRNGSFDQTTHIANKIYIENDAEAINKIWIENNELCVSDALNGEYDISYIKNPYLYKDANDATPISIPQPYFISDFVVAKTYLENEDDTMYQAFILQAQEKLTKMKLLVV